MIDFKQFEVLSFDCYGTLIDWDNGILGALKPILSNHNVSLSDEQILEAYAQVEAAHQSGDYLKYREVLKRLVQAFGERLNFIPTDAEAESLAESIKGWEPFPDTVEALKALKKSYKLTIISNIDDDLFAATARKLDVEFDWIITAEQVKSYKPSRQNFEFALQRMGITPDKLLHIAQSVYHDIIPTRSMGLSSVWVNRRGEKQDNQVIDSASGKPDLEVPDLKTLVSLMSLDS
ncbi:haloacid dehalogenase type II [Microcoleus sp. FACHB-SPT15]|uniref:haloacid dehalogenase type II n=1 Tax=Microcoleus sp. FACHB-SPT15 TaxID=2692830 RepID=UPI001780AAA9|nr:haloacid dehalogenase type II [Microcoleus sp. FACHB-SPT15]MBD1808212.1 haloacid dehalogenase type II [Microcoleus sp. FACHB-SPT15]